MPEIRIHGRGGQGTVLAAKILAKALVEEGKYTMAIPAFGFERRGAPVVAFLRYEDHEIRAVTNIYSPNIIMCIDPSIATVVDIFEGISDHATLVQASKKPLDQIVRPEAIERVGLCDAVGIALDVFSKQITNTIMLGAFARTTGVVTLDSLKKGLSVTNFRDAGLEQNMIAIERGYNETTVYDLTKEAAA